MSIKLTGINPFCIYAGQGISWEIFALVKDADAQAILVGGMPHIAWEEGWEGWEGQLHKRPKLLTAKLLHSLQPFEFEDFLFEEGYLLEFIDAVD